ncbi:MAG: FAD-dependent oxidoreductase [Pseudomonadota bacterium]
MRDPRYDILFEPIEIGPVTAKNRFYQVPHCSGTGWLRPRMLATMRGTKAEGGWGVVCTEWCSVHPSSDDLPYPNASIWDQGDIHSHSLMTEAVHEHGALAGVELWLGGARPQNLFTREVGLDVASLPNGQGHPSQSRAMDRQDIRNVRRWHRDAAIRARDAGFDIVYVYATHGYLLSNFLSADTNNRSDEYGGSLENRVRLVRELIEETKDAVGDRCAVAVRFSAEEGGGGDCEPVIGEHRDMLAMLAELPDLWDINIDDYSLEMGTSRFVAEGSLNAYANYVKSVTSKPVVTVGRFTSPDTMASLVRNGIADFVGAARPSIADPFLPQKIEEGRPEDIRECIGCNICYTGDGTGTPIHCTQNPTISEGWRRGWHPERIPPKASDASVLVIGAGPAGLEATRALGQRGYSVMLAEASRELGGRVNLEAQLPGLNEWIRVRDYRVQQIQSMKNVDVLLDNHLSTDDALAAEVDHIVVATGAQWRRDGRGRAHVTPPTQWGPAERLYTPDDLLAGHMPQGTTLVFDDDHYYLGSTLAEKLLLEGIQVVFVTASAVVSSWSGYTSEQSRVQRRLMELGATLVLSHTVDSFNGDSAILTCGYTGATRSIAAENLLCVTSREPNNALYYSLAEQLEAEQAGRLKSVRHIGDCNAPGIIASAVFSGHRYARELDASIDQANPLKYDRVFFEA